MPLDLPSFVSIAFDRHVDAVSSSPEDDRKLRSIGFVRADGGWRMSVADEREKADAFSILRDKGFAFSLGKEWNPSEMFQLLVAKGLLRGPYLEIGWSSPTTWTLHERLAPPPFEAADRSARDEHA